MRRPRTLRWALGITYLFVVAAGAFLAFVVVEHAAGRVPAFVALVTFFCVPIGAAVLVEKAAAKLRRELHAENLAAWLLPFWSAGFVTLLCVSARGPTGDALLAVPERHEWASGWLGEPIRRLGLVLSPRIAPPSARPPAAADGTPSAPRPPSDAPSPESSGPAPSATPPRPPARDRFASGDRSYQEDVAGCEPLAPIDAVQSAHVPGATRATAEALAKARYPVGLPFLQVQDDKQLLVWFTRAPETFDGVASRFDAAVHEGAHLWGIKRFNPSTQTYPVRDGLAIVARRMKSFPWREILTRHVDVAADTYAKTYLEGPSGEQGVNTLLDEYDAYAHSLAARYCTRDLLSPGSRVSARDGMLTMMYYLETYLAIARTAHPADHAAILADAGQRRVIVTVWDRAEHWLRKSASIPSLGIHDDVIEGWVYDPERLAEVARVRAHGGPNAYNVAP